MLCILKMYDFRDISIIVHCRIDNEERGKNATLVYNFYKDHTTNCQFIFVEDDIENKLSKYVSTDDIDIHLMTNNNDIWHKTGSYNLGAKASSRKYLYFLDLDVIVHPKHICQAITTDSDLVIGYNGQAIYLTYNAKRLLEDDPTYTKLECFIPRDWLCSGELVNDNIKIVQDYRTSQTGTPLNMYEFCMAPNNSAVGGCVITPRETFFEYKGFNPNFFGWGYEDNELPTRVDKLGYNVSRINSPEALLFHLPHDPVTGDPSKNAHSDSNTNYIEMDKINNISKTELKEYIKTWNV
jgi:GT2 family glycosyltransferase